MAHSLVFEARQICKLIPISERTLRYLGDRKIIIPEVADVQGRPGIRRRYSFRNLVEIGLAQELFQYGITLSEIQDILAFVNKAKFFRLHPDQFWVIIQEGRAVGVLYSSLSKSDTKKLQTQFGKWFKHLATNAGTTLGERLEEILDVANEGASLLAVGLHHIRHRLKSKTSRQEG